MNILMVGLDLNPPWVEGIRNTVHDLSLYLLERGHGVYYLTKGYREQKECEEIDGIIYHRILTKEKTGYIRGSSWFLLKLFKTLAKIVKKTRIDIIHAHSVYPFFGTYLGLLSSPIRSKKIFTQYSFARIPSTFEYPKMLNIGLNAAKSHFLPKINGYLLHEIIVTSKRAYSKLSRLTILRDKLKYVPIGIDPNRFNPSLGTEKIRNELNIANDCKVVLFAGDLTPFKGAEVMVRSMKLVSERHPHVKCIMLTKGIYEHENSRIIKVRNLIKDLEMQSKVMFLGVRGDIEYVYASSDMVVLPFSSSYALIDVPRALLEAMAVGKPVVASDVGSISEVITHMKTGLLVKGDDVAELANAINLLIEDEGLSERLGRNSRSVVEEKFAWTRIVCEIEELYRRA